MVLLTTLILTNFRKGETPEIDMDMYENTNKEMIYHSVIEFTGKDFVCYRTYNGNVTATVLGESFEIDYSKIAKDCDKPTIINMMRNAIECCILQAESIIMSLEYPKCVISIYARYNLLCDGGDIDKFLEECYFMVS